MATLSIRRFDPVRLGEAAFGALVGVGALVLVHGAARFTSYGGRSEAAAALGFVSGLSLILAGLITSRSRLGGRMPPIAMLAGLLWFAPVYEGWSQGPTFVRSLAMVAASFAVPLLLHLVLAYPTGRLRSGADPWVLIAIYAGAAFVALGRALFRDPFFDPSCWANCTDNAFLLRSMPGFARTLTDGGRWLDGVVAVAVTAIVLVRLAAGSRPVRRALAPIVVPAFVVASATVGRAVVMARRPLEDPSDPTFFSLFVLTCAGMIGLAGALGWAVADARRQSRVVARTVASLAEIPAPGTLGSALAAAIGDPGLSIAYVLANPTRYVDAGGVAVDEPVAGVGRSLTTLVRGVRPIAVISHAAVLSDLEREIGPAFRLGLENERLQAEVLAYLEALRASRARIVETGDAERRRLERDLHDGAQQRLLALSYDFRVALASAEREGDESAASWLRRAIEEAKEALADLRELAHGIYPAILFEAGLGAAAESLADSAPIRVGISVVDGRYPPVVEGAIYLVMEEGIEDASRRGATLASIGLTRDADAIVLTVGDDGTEPRGDMVAIADRVGAVGGQLVVEPNTLRAEIPCG